MVNNRILFLSRTLERNRCVCRPSEFKGRVLERALKSSSVSKIEEDHLRKISKNFSERKTELSLVKLNFRPLEIC